MPNQFPSSTSSQPTLSKKVNNSDPKVTNHDGPSFVVHPSVGQDKSTAPETSLPPKGLIIGTDTQRRQMKSIKPSGLRLPSPSIGFFSQVHQSSDADVIIIAAIMLLFCVLYSALSY